MKIRFVSLISRENRPLYIQTFHDDSKAVDSDEMNELLKYNFLSHMTIDVFESPFSGTAQQLTNGKTALLFVHDGVLVYGAETQNGLKIVVGYSRFDSGDGEAEAETEKLREVIDKENGLGSLQGFADRDIIELNDVDKIVNTIKKEYIRYTCNPFVAANMEAEIDNLKFDQRIRKIIDEFNHT